MVTFTSELRLDGRCRRHQYYSFHLKVEATATGGSHGNGWKPWQRVEATVTRWKPRSRGGSHSKEELDHGGHSQRVSSQVREDPRGRRALEGRHRHPEARRQRTRYVAPAAHGRDRAVLY